MKVVGEQAAHLPRSLSLLPSCHCLWMTMGQSWMLIDLDVQEIIGGQGKLGEWFWSRGDMLESLKVPPSSLKIDTLLKGPVEAQNFSLVHRLPLEVFDFVVDNLIGTKDKFGFFSLAVTCKTILCLLRKRILTWQRQHSRSTRVGHRIICVGEYAEMFPPGVQTTEELQQLALHLTRSAYDIMGYVYARLQSSCNQPPNRDIQSLIAVMQDLKEYGTLSPQMVCGGSEVDGGCMHSSFPLGRPVGAVQHLKMRIRAQGRCGAAVRSPPGRPPQQLAFGQADFRAPPPREHLVGW
ncbi:hypothetical protein BD413DRAFT_5677 [Trametes elegans]|nr:hypothetical protein BD413DRAFT_5677 [Trametes elegans]